MNRLKGMFLFFACVLFSCGKTDLPEPMTGEPVFFFKGQLGSDATTINAGDNDFYMFTEFSKDDFDVFTFTGRLAKLEPDCGSNCSEQLVIRIRDARSTSSNIVDDINQSIPLGNYDFEFVDSGTSIFVGYEVQFKNKSFGSSPNPSYNWKMNNTPFATAINPIDTFSQLNFDVELEIMQDSFDFCTSSYTRQITIDSLSTCGVGFELLSVPASGTTLRAIPMGNAPFIYEWNDGSGNVDSINLIPDTMFTYCVTVTDGTGCMSDNCFVSEFSSGSSDIYCSAAFDYEVEMITELMPADSFRFSMVSIEYTNENGMLYRSLLNAQPSSSFFEITEITDFEANEKGESTKKISLRMNATLFASDGSTFQLNSEETEFGIAYPD